jgi:hypothetical protein
MTHAPPRGRIDAASTMAASACRSARSATAIAVFPSVTYLESDRGDVVALCGSEIPLGPLSLRLEIASPGFPDWLSMESAIRFASGGIDIGGELLSWEGAEAWDPQPRWSAVDRGAPAWHETLDVLASTVRSESPPGSLAILLDESWAAPGSPAMTDRVLRETLRRATDFLRKLSASSARQASPELERAARRLAGLGGGFTPAGDDFLLGVLHALYVSLPANDAHRMGAIVAEAARLRTTTVSAAYLAAASKGGAGQSWHNLVDGLASGNADQLGTAVGELAAIGHTSGADALTGFVLGLSALAGG